MKKIRKNAQGREYYSKVPKLMTPQKQRTSKSSNEMSQVLANPESRDLHEMTLQSRDLKTNFPFLTKIMDMIDIQNKCHTDPRFANNDYLTFLFITLKIRYLFSKSIPFTFFAILFFEVSMWSTCFSHPKVMTLRKQLSESSGSRRVLHLIVLWVVTFRTFKTSQSQYHSHNSLFLFDIHPVFWAIKTIL